MINFNIKSHTYTCPFCGHDQAFDKCVDIAYSGLYSSWSDERFATNYEHYENCIENKNLNYDFKIFTLRCSNLECREISVVAINRGTGEQIDLIPQVVVKQYPDYIPQSIRQDYTEAVMILERSPKAAAALLRRCLQTMIRDFWGIQDKKNLAQEIDAIKEMITPSQWNALDGLRKIGNIGAHMEKDVNLIIEVEPEEAEKLQKLIELLLDKWYVARHDEEQLCKGITSSAATKMEQKHGSGNQKQD